MKQRISPKAFDLIVRFESGGREYYEKVLKRPTWPGGRSGVTIGFGWDCGYEQNLDRDWGQFLDAEQLRRLARCLGKTGSVARQALSGVRDIVIKWEWAEEVFNELTLPQEIRKTLSTFPGAADKLPADAFGALVSLVFNRGTDTNDHDSRRIEMRQIKLIIEAATQPAQSSTLERIAKQIRSMKRLWHDNPDSDGDLVDRREAEAKLVEESI